MTRRISNFDAPDRFVAGTIGEPGHRAFFLQARQGGAIVSVAAEKTQVAVLAANLAALLDTLSERGVEGIPADAGDRPIAGRRIKTEIQAFFGEAFFNLLSISPTGQGLAHVLLAFLQFETKIRTRRYTKQSKRRLLKNRQLPISPNLRNKK